MPNYFYLDASALAQRYVPEPGTAVMDHLFSCLPPQRLFVLHLGIAEVVSILVRKQNAKFFSPRTIAQAFRRLEAEIVTQPMLRKMQAEAALIDAALPLIGRHSINATDAVLLRSALDVAASLRINGDDLVLVASDQRLLRAAQAEGLLSFNPETQSVTELDLLLV